MDKNGITGKTTLDEETVVKIKQHAWKLLGIIFVITVIIAFLSISFGRSLDAKNGTHLKFAILCGLGGMVIAAPLIAVAAKKTASDIQEILRIEKQNKEVKYGGSSHEL